MSGTGNIFILVDLRNPNQKKLWSQQPAHQIARDQLATLLCQNGTGFSADGLLFIEPCSTKDANFEWDFYNADGSRAEMCGNTARCVTLFAHSTGDIANVMKFKTQAGIVGAKVNDRQSVTVQMPVIGESKWDQYATIDDLKTHYHLVNSGVPHAVVGNDNVILTEEARLFASRLRNHEDLQPSGANVTFYRPIKSGQIQAVTYERGVENFTQACGTGAVAAAWCHTQRQQGPQRVEVVMPGGPLLVEFAGSQPLLTGPAFFIGEFRLHADYFKNLTVPPYGE